MSKISEKAGHAFFIGIPFSGHNTIVQIVKGENFMLVNGQVIAEMYEPGIRVTANGNRTAIVVSRINGILKAVSTDYHAVCKKQGDKVILENTKTGKIYDITSEKLNLPTILIDMQNTRNDAEKVFDAWKKSDLPLKEFAEANGGWHEMSDNNYYIIEFPDGSCIVDTPCSENTYNSVENYLKVLDEWEEYE